MASGSTSSVRTPRSQVAGTNEGKNQKEKAHTGRINYEGPTKF